MSKVKGLGTVAEPWQLKTPPGTSDYHAYRDDEAEPPALVVQVGKTQLRYQWRCIEDLHTMLAKTGEWVLLGSADEQKPAAAGTVEAWAGRPRIRSRGGTASRRGSAGASGCMSRRFSRRLDSRRSSTI